MNPRLKKQTTELAMKTTLHALLTVALLSSGTAFAQDQGEVEETPAPTSGAPTQAPGAMPANPGTPPGAQGYVAPAPSPQGYAPGPQGYAAPAPVAAAPVSSEGQWSYTSQYGWVWLPYAQPYTYVAGDGGIAYQYAWYPSWGWRWLEAPWVLGWGPRPYWGYGGYNHFAWYSHPWYHAGVYRGGYGYGYRGGYAAGYHGGYSAGYHGGYSNGYHGATPAHFGGGPQAAHRPQPSFGGGSHFAGHGVSHGGGGHGGGGGRR
jgi:hypothetical protein